jgi:hypothetical protein
MRPEQRQQEFVPLSDDEIERLIAQGLGHLLKPYRVGSLCPPRQPGSDPLPQARWPRVA